MTTDTNHILKLAEIIREVDGGNRLGAAALAEAILSHHGSRWSPAVKPEEPTDEELLAIAAASIDGYQGCGIAIGEYEPENECAVEAYGSELITFARAVLARWGRPTIQPPSKPSHHTAQDSSQRP